MAFAARRAAVVVFAMLLLPGCPREAPMPVPADNQANSHAAPAPEPVAPVEEPIIAAPAAELPPPAAPAPDPGKWFFVERIKPGARGGWGTADFEPDKNRLSVDLHDVTRFRIDTTRVGIDWDRLVLLRIDGHTSELKRRDITQYHFARDLSGAWVVVEPGAELAE
jgi:hypothetical protein